MKFFSIFSSLILASTATVYALPSAPEFEILEIRGYIDVPASLIQLRAGDDEFERRDEIIRIETRGDGSGGELNKASDILDKTGKGLTVASLATKGVPILGQAVDVLKTAVDIFSKVLGAIGKAQHKDALKRGAFTQDVVSETLKKHPGWNCIVVHTQHKKDFKGAQGKDWAHSHQELKVSWGKTIGFEIYTFREGYFELQGDGGFLNWAYGGKVLKGTAKEKKLTFGASSNAKGTASDAVKGTGEQVAKKQDDKKKKKASPKRKKGRSLD